MVNTPTVQPTAQRQMLTIKKIPKTVEILHDVQRHCLAIQKVVEVSFMDEVVEVRVVMKGRSARFRIAEDLDVATDPVHRQDRGCCRDDATPGSHNARARHDRCL